MRKLAALSLPFWLFVLPQCGGYAAPPPVLAATVGPTADMRPLDATVYPRTRTCSALLSVDLVAIGGEGSRFTRVTEGVRGGVEICSVEATLAPSVGFHLELPTKTWTQRYLQVGCSGLCGSVSLKAGAADGCPLLDTNGFAIASTDMGHDRPGGDFGSDPLKRADFAYRAVHLTNITAKRLIATFYGRPADRSYFSGCSDGGREGLMEAERFPADFDGIVAGAPVLSFEVQNSFVHGWEARSNTDPTGEAVLVASRLPILHDAVLAACDGLDGQVDGLVSAPQACHFDPSTLQCSSDLDKGQCLTGAEVETVRRIYEGPKDHTTGERFTVGGPQPGSELAWAGAFVPASPRDRTFSQKIALDSLGHLIFDTDPPARFTLADLNFDRPTFDKLRPRHPLFDATDPDLSAFAQRGGKLIVWHGWADEHVSPIGSIAYHQAVEETLGRGKTESFERLYLLPGVHHCSGGEGPSAVDMLTPMMLWVERNQAPDAIVVKDPPKAKTVRARPVYPYPYIAQYGGKGGADDAASYHRSDKRYEVTVPAWAGSDFYRFYSPRLQ